MEKDGDLIHLDLPCAEETAMVLIEAVHLTHSSTNLNVQGVAQSGARVDIRGNVFPSAELTMLKEMLVGGAGWGIRPPCLTYVR